MTTLARIIPAVVYLAIGIALGTLYVYSVRVFKTDGRNHWRSLPSDYLLADSIRRSDRDRACEILSLLRDVDYSQTAYTDSYALLLGGEGHEQSLSSGMLFSVGVLAVLIFYTGNIIGAGTFVLGFILTVWVMRKLGRPYCYIEKVNNNSDSVSAKSPSSTYGNSTYSELEDAYNHCHILDVRNDVLRKQAKQSASYRPIFWVAIGFVGAFAIFSGLNTHMYSTSEIESIKETAYYDGYDAGRDAEHDNLLWGEGDFVNDVDVAITPLKQAYSKIENHLLEGEEAPELSELYELMYEGFNNLDDAVRSHCNGVVRDYD